MKDIVYIQDGKLVFKSYADANEEIKVDVPYVILDREISEPIESWYIEDGQIKIDQQKLIEFNRQNMPTLSPIDFDLLLDKFELYDAVQDLVATNRTLKIAYNRATFFSRTSEFIIQASELLGLTPEQVDAMWTTPH